MSEETIPPSTGGTRSVSHEVERLVHTVESCAAHMTQHFRLAVTVLSGDGAEIGALPARPATIQELDRHAQGWAPFVPASADIRAEMIHLLATRHTFHPDLYPAVTDVLGVHQAEVRRAYGERFGQPLESIYRQPQAGAEADTDTWGDAAQREIMAQLSWVRLTRGEVIVRQGDPSDAMYVVLHGRLEVSVASGDGQPRLVRELGPGDTIGEMGLITRAPRAATVTAARDCELIELPRTGFEWLVDHHPRALLNITRALARHLVESSKEDSRRASLKTIAVIPGASGVKTGDFCRSLVASLGRYGLTSHISRQTVSQAWGEEFDASDPAVVGWLNLTEVESRYVVYEADPARSPWSLRTIRQADRLLLVLPAGSGIGNIALIDEILAAQGVERDLVLLHERADDRPSGTARYLDTLHPTRHFHLRDSDPRDMERLTRSILGQGVGLVLGGGGARGFTHVGVLQALEETGIPIDYVAGSSTGSVVAAAYALGWTAQDILQRCKEIANQRLIDYTVPAISVLSAKRFTHLLDSMFGEQQIEDLWLPYFCVSSNLSSAELVAHRRGSIRRALRASCALPGVMPPVVENGELLVDGIVLNNLPVDVMKTFSDNGSVIAVDVSMQFDVSARYDFGESLSAVEVLWNKYSPFSKTKFVVPSFMSVMLRSYELNHVATQNTQIELAGLYLHPPVGTYSTFDVKNLDVLVKIGYDYAMERLRASRFSGDMSTE